MISWNGQTVKMSRRFLGGNLLAFLEIKTGAHRARAVLILLLRYPIFFFIENFSATLYTLSSFPINSLACAPP